MRRLPSRLGGIFLLPLIEYNHYCRLLLWLFVKFLSAIAHGQMSTSASKYIMIDIVIKFFYSIQFSTLWYYFFGVVCRYHNVNINVAVQTDNGLFVPVIRVSGCYSLCAVDIYSH